MDGDVSPQLSEESDDNNEPPTGDIAELTASVQQHAATGASQGTAALPESSARTTAYKGKGKGVGKRKSGSSGPPVKCRRPTATKSRPFQEAEEELSNEEDDNEVATQSIKVRSHRGYTTYPAYMFDIPPRKLKTDNLRKE